MTSDLAFGVRSPILVCQDLSRDACAGVGYRPASLRWQELPRFLPIQEMRRRRPIQHAILTLRWTLSAKRACVWPRTASLIGLLLSPASAPWASAGLR